MCSTKKIRLFEDFIHLTAIHHEYVEVGVLQTNQNDAFGCSFLLSNALVCKSVAKHVRQFDKTKNAKNKSTFMQFISLISTFQSFLCSLHSLTITTRFYDITRYQISYILWILAHSTIFLRYINQLGNKTTDEAFFFSLRCHEKRFNPVVGLMHTDLHHMIPRIYCTRKIVK